MTKKQLMNRMSVACWEFYKKYHAQVPLDEHTKQIMADEAICIADKYSETKAVRRILSAYCDELCDEKENEDG